MIQVFKEHMDQEVWTHSEILNSLVSCEKQKLLLMRWKLSGYSKSALRTGFKMGPFYLDAGHSVFSKWDVLLISHGHADHIFSLPSFFLVGKREDVPYVFAPNTDLIKPIANSVLRSNHDTDKFHVSANFIDANPGDIHDLQFGQDKYRVHIVKMDHSVPTVGYAVSKETTRLNPELVSLKGSLDHTEFVTLMKALNTWTDIPEDLALRISHAGMDFGHARTLQTTICHWLPQFCFLTDTSIKGISCNLDLIKEYPIIIVECTFYHKDDLGHTEAKKHIHWLQLEPYIRASDSLWILIHSSRRYVNRTDIISAIGSNESGGAVPENCLFWI
jgi:ribonuclease Z